MIDLLLRTTFAMLIAFGGGLLGVMLGRLAPHRLSLLVYAAMGALLAVTAFAILPEAKAQLSWLVFLAAAASGYALFWFLSKYVAHVCPACSVSAFDQATTERLGQSVVLLMIALGLHCAMDGVAVVVGDRIEGRPNWPVVFAVSFHKLPEGLALALLLLGAGYARRTALLWTWGIEAMTLGGALIAIVGLRQVSVLDLSLVFAHVGGGFVYLIVSTLGLFSHRPDQRPSLQSRIPFVVSSGAAFAFTAGLILTFNRFFH